MNPAQVKRIDLSPGAVDCIVFWTKDPQNLMPYMSEIDAMGFKYYFQFTLTPYGNDLERDLRGKDEIIDTFVKLSNQIGQERVVWRYDPIVLNERYDVDYHTEQFSRMCERLCNYTNGVTISFVDMYPKLKTSLIREITEAEMLEIAGRFSEIAAGFKLPVKTCCEKSDFSRFGIVPAACIDRELIEKICGHPIAVKPDKNQREHCNCAASVDIGAYNTCQHGCVYCYANYSPKSVTANLERHNLNGAFLIERAGE